MDLKEKPVAELVEETAARTPTPGGGSIGASVGALAAALGGMVCSYTAEDEEVKKIQKRLSEIAAELLSVMTEDVTAFSKVNWKNPTESALQGAVEPPKKLVILSFEALTLLENLLDKGNRNLLSDVGCGALCAKASLQMGWLNVKANLPRLSDAFVQSVTEELLPLVSMGAQLAEHIYSVVEKGE